jgi:hypothetical protein
MRHLSTPHELESNQKEIVSGNTPKPAPRFMAS